MHGTRGDLFEKWRAPMESWLATSPPDGAAISRTGFPGTRPWAVMGEVVMTQALRQAGIEAPGHGFRSSFKGWARQHDVDELLSEFALAHVEGSATVAAYACDDLLEKRRPVMQARADCISG